MAYGRLSVAPMSDCQCQPLNMTTNKTSFHILSLAHSVVSTSMVLTSNASSHECHIHSFTANTAIIRVPTTPYMLHYTTL